jgi:hypothetical protein
MSLQTLPGRVCDVPHHTLSFVALYILSRVPGNQESLKSDSNFMNRIKDYMYEGSGCRLQLCRKTNSPQARMFEG